MTSRVAQEQPPLDGSALAMSIARPGAGSALAVAGEAIVFCAGGSGTLVGSAGAVPLGAGAAALVPAGEEATLRAEGDGLEAVVATLAEARADLHAPLGPLARSTKRDATEPSEATGARSFQVLYGPHNGCVRATLFVGSIPPGRAPWHYHLYDEIVWVLRGEGRLHLRDAEPEALGHGSCFRLRPREVHIVENVDSAGELAVLGLFTPAGSPSAAYLEPDVFAAYTRAG